MSVKIKQRSRVLVANAIGNLKLSMTEDTIEGQLASLTAAKHAIDQAIATQTTENAGVKPTPATGAGKGQ